MLEFCVSNISLVLRVEVSLENFNVYTLPQESVKMIVYLFTKLQIVVNLFDKISRLMKSSIYKIIYYLLK